MNQKERLDKVAEIFGRDTKQEPWDRYVFCGGDQTLFKSMITWLQEKGRIESFQFLEQGKELVALVK